MRSVTNQKKFISNLGSQNFVDVDMETFRLESIAALNKISLERKTLENNDLKDATLHFWLRFIYFVLLKKDFRGKHCNEIIENGSTYLDYSIYLTDLQINVK